MKLQTRHLFVFILPLFSLSGANAKEVAGWQVSQHDDHCRMWSDYENDVIISFEWYPRDENYWLLVASRDWQSLRFRDGKNVNMIINLSGPVEFDEWKDGNALIVAPEEGLAGVYGLWGRQHSEDFLNSFALAVSMKVQIDGKNVGSFRLDGSRSAMIELRRCGAALIKNGGDPFVK